jgi:hypothetical protein
VKVMRSLEGTENLTVYFKLLLSFIFKHTVNELNI